MSLSDHAETEMPKKDGIWIAQEHIDLEKARIDEINALANALEQLNCVPVMMPAKQEYQESNKSIRESQVAIAKKLQQLAGE